MRTKFRLLLVALLALSLSLGVAAGRGEDAAAYSTGYSISPCSYAGHNCWIHIDMWCTADVEIIWYTNTGGVNGYRTFTYNLGGGGAGWDNYQYIWSNERADSVTLDDHGSGCLRGSYLIGVDL